MGGKNKYLEQLDKARMEGFLLGQHFTRQLSLDLAAITLNREFGFGADRCERFSKSLIERYGHYSDIFNKDTKDVIYSKEHMDESLRQIYGDKLIPWEKRYEKP